MCERCFFAHRFRMLGDDGRQAEMVFLQFFNFVVNMFHIFRHPRNCLGEQRNFLSDAKTICHPRPITYTRVPKMTPCFSD